MNDISKSREVRLDRIRRTSCLEEQAKGLKRLLEISLGIEKEQQPRQWIERQSDRRQKDRRIQDRRITP